MLVLGGCSGGVPVTAAERYHDSVGKTYRGWLEQLGPDGSLPADPSRAYTPEEKQIRIDAVDDFGRLLDEVNRASIVGGSQGGAP
jgi:hypothetical protein